VARGRRTLGPGQAGWDWGWSTVVFWTLLSLFFLGLYIAAAVGVSLSLYLLQRRGWRFGKR
jgi:hypothetical protein